MGSGSILGSVFGDVRAPVLPALLPQLHRRGHGQRGLRRRRGERQPQQRQSQQPHDNLGRGDAKSRQHDPHLVKVRQRRR